MEGQRLFEYEYLMPETPSSPDRLIINTDAQNGSGDACPDSPLLSAPLPPCRTVREEPPASWWYTLTQVETTSIPSQALPPTHEESESSVEPSSSVVSDKRPSADNSFNIDRILELEQHYCNPRHSTPAKPNVTRIQHTDHMTPIFPAEFESQSQHAGTNEGVYVPKQVSRVYTRNSDKPPYTYVAMVAVAIMNSEEKQLTLGSIREQLQDMFPFFRGEYTGWKSSVRHCLTNSKCFYKVEISNETLPSPVSVWRVDISNVRPSTFYRQNKGPDYESYKLTLQEQLGLPPFGFSEDLVKKDSMKLPPKPCFTSDPSVSLAVCTGDDFLNARNDVPTPFSVISDTSSVNSEATIPSRKRKLDDLSEPTSSSSAAPFPTIHPAFPHSTTSYLASSQWNSDYYPTDRTPYYNLQMPSFQQYGYSDFYSTQDMYRYGNPQMWTGTQSQAWNLYSDEQRMRYLYQSVDWSMTPSSYQRWHQPYNEVFPYTVRQMAEQSETALNLTKMEKKSSN